MNELTNDSEGTNYYDVSTLQLKLFYEIPQWRIEMIEYLGELLTPEEVKVLQDGPWSLATSWQIRGLKKEWERMCAAM